MLGISPCHKGVEKTILTSSSHSRKYGFRGGKKNRKKSFLEFFAFGTRNLLIHIVLSLTFGLEALRVPYGEGQPGIIKRPWLEPRHFARDFTDTLLSVSELAQCGHHYLHLMMRESWAQKEHTVFPSFFQLGRQQSDPELFSLFSAIRRHPVQRAPVSLGSPWGH